MKLLILIFPALIVGTTIAAADPLKSESRSAEYIEKTDLKADEAYRRAKEWLASNYAKSSESIQLDDPKAKKLIARASLTACRALGASPDYILRFLIKFEARENRVKIDFENVWYFRDDTENPDSANPTYYAKAYPFKAAELAEIKAKCLDPVKGDLVSALKAKKKKW